MEFFPPDLYNCYLVERGKMERKWWDLAVFLLNPLKFNLPNLRGKCEWKWGAKALGHFGGNYPSILNDFFVSFFFCFFHPATFNILNVFLFSSLIFFFFFWSSHLFFYFYFCSSVSFQVNFFLRKHFCLLNFLCFWKKKKN